MLQRSPICTAHCACFVVSMTRPGRHSAQIGLAMKGAAATPIAYQEKPYARRLCILAGTAGAPTLFCMPGAGASITSNVIDYEQRQVGNH